MFSETDNPDRYYINGKQFDPNRVDIQSKLNTVEEWTIRNENNEEHSFHVHVHVDDFQLMSINGQPHDGHGWQDTAPFPSRGRSSFGSPSPTTPVRPSCTATSSTTRTWA